VLYLGVIIGKKSKYFGESFEIDQIEVHQGNLIMSRVLGLVGSSAICLLLGTIFVASLYFIVPGRVKQLARDHPTHVSAAIGQIVCFVTILC
jgi:ABC-type transport system involved in multi-copper enzyme maturation permease subunit